LGKLIFVNSMKEKYRKYSIYIFYTLIFAVISLAAFLVFIKSGRSFIWSPDGFRQHYVILYDFNTMIKNIFQDGISMFSWNMGLGLDVIGQYSYYILGDPFAYISLIFPIKYLEYVYELLVILRIYCVGIVFMIYCKYNKKDNYNTIIGALIYTFSGYIMYAAVRHPYFVNPIIMLPLVLLGIDKILKEDKYIWFTISIAILAIMNYYFLYMITILAVMYAVAKYILEYRELGIKEFGTKFAKTALCYIIGVMIAGIILLPTIYAFFTSDRSGVGYTHYNIGYYQRLLFSQPDTPYWSKTYVSIIGILMLPIGILNLKKNKENKTILANIAISIIMLLFPVFGSIMNGFSFQSNRWSFAFSFYIAYLVVINLRKNIKYNGKEIISMLFIFIIYMILALIADRVNRAFILMSVVVAGFIIMMLVFRNIYKKHQIQVRKLCKILILLLICGNIVAYAWGLYSKFGGNYVDEFIHIENVDRKYNKYGGKIKNFDKAIDYIEQKDNDFYRIGTPIYNNNNYSLIHDYNGLNMYLSIGNGYICDFSKEMLVLGHNKTNALNEYDSRTKLTTFLGTKYYITPKDRKQYTPYGYKLIKEYKNTQIYENENNLTIGVFYDNFIVKEDYDKLSTIEKEQALLETAVIDNSSVIETTNINYNENLINTIKDTAKEINYTILDKDNNLKDKNFSIEFEQVENCELYLYFDNLEYDSTDEYFVKAKYNDIEKEQRVRDRITSPYYVKTPNILFNLGYKEKHLGKIKIKLSGKRKLYL